MKPERIVYIAASVVAVAAAFAAYVVDGDLELTLMMLSAVCAGLLCFDVAMNKHLRSFWPWLLFSIAPASKTFLTVWNQLLSTTETAERFDHLGSLLFASFILMGVMLLARPAAALGGGGAWFDWAVIVGSGAVSAAAGASVAYVFDADFGSTTTARLIETSSWFFVGAILAAAVTAASRAVTVRLSLMGVLVGACAGAALLAINVAGWAIDNGAWTAVFAIFTVSAGTPRRGILGQRRDRSRQTNAGAVVAIVAGIVAAGAAISARSDRAAWSSGWVVLGVLALTMLGLAMASRPVVHEIESETEADAAKQRALTSLGSSIVDTSPEAIEAEAVASDAFSADVRGVVPAAAVAPIANQESADSALASDDDFSSGPERQRRLSSQTAEAGPVDDDVPPVPEPATAPAAAVPPVAAPAPVPVSRAAESVAPPAHSVVASSGPFGQAASLADSANRSAPAGGQPVSPAGGQPVSPAGGQPVSPAGSQSLSDSSLVASAKAAADVRNAAPAQRHDLAPVERAHFFDPSTGLLSAAGLQHGLGQAFAVPRHAGHVTIMLFTVRDLDRIEDEHGRLASAAVTREIAQRIRLLLPQGTGARFTRSAYAILFVGDLSDAQKTIQWLAHVLLQLRAPVEGGTLGDKIDVVASMAQCYHGESVAQFVQRANQGLARAVGTPSPTFVAMP